MYEDLQNFDSSRIRYIFWALNSNLQDYEVNLKQNKLLQARVLKEKSNLTTRRAETQYETRSSPLRWGLDISRYDRPRRRIRTRRLGVRYGIMKLGCNEFWAQARIGHLRVSCCARWRSRRQWKRNVKATICTVSRLLPFCSELRTFRVNSRLPYQ
jgi:hypothetical protein